MRCALVAGLAILIASSSARAADKEIEIRGPDSVYQGETAIFYSRSEGAPASLHFAVTGPRGTVQRFTDSRSFTVPGRYEIELVTPGFEHEKKSLEVRELPPYVSSDAPVAARRAAIEIYVWDGDRSNGGHDLEEAGRKLGPYWAKAAYHTQWILAGRQATRANVGYAIDELARRGYILDVYSAVHGYPIKLADGEWRDVASNPGLKHVRLFYTTACHGAAGEEEFRKAGVETYVGASGVNFINAAHMKLFFDQWKKGKDVDWSNDHAFKFLKAIADAPVLGFLVRDLVHFFDPRHTVLAPKNDFDAVLVKSRPIVFGDGAITRDSDLPPAARAPVTRGIVMRLEH